MALRNTFNAAVQRGSTVYSVSQLDPRRDQFKQHIKDWLREFGTRYVAWEYTPQMYMNEIRDLKSSVNGAYAAILQPGMITLGISQKLVSLSLKYLWLLGNPDKKPLFPPLDGEVFAEIGINVKGGFKKLDDPTAIDDLWRQTDSHASKRGKRSGTIWEAEWWSGNKQDDNPASSTPDDFDPVSNL